MERNNVSPADRHDAIARLRRQVERGAYRPPVDEVVNRLVSAVMARRSGGGPAASR